MPTRETKKNLTQRRKGAKVEGKSRISRKRHKGRKIWNSVGRNHTVTGVPLIPVEYYFGVFPLPR